MRDIPLETCWAFNVLWNNKFRYQVASCWLLLLSLTMNLFQVAFCHTCYLQIPRQANVSYELRYHLPYSITSRECRNLFSTLWNKESYEQVTFLTALRYDIDGINFLHESVIVWKYSSINSKLKMAMENKVHQQMLGTLCLLCGNTLTLVIKIYKCTTMLKIDTLFVVSKVIPLQA